MDTLQYDIRTNSILINDNILVYDVKTVQY